MPPLKGPLTPRDAPRSPFEKENMDALMEKDGMTKDTRAVVYESHKRSSKLSVFKSTTSSKKAQEGRGRGQGQPQQSRRRGAPPPAPQRPAYDNIASEPEPFPRQFWGEPPGEGFRVRGSGYLSDRKKIPSEESMFRLITADVVEVTRVLPDGGSMCLHPEGRVQRALRRSGGERGAGGGDESFLFPPFLFCVNIRVPNPKPGREFHIVAYYAVDDMSKIDGTGTCPSSKLAKKFFFGDDDGDYSRPALRTSSSFSSASSASSGGRDGDRSDLDAFRDETFKFVPRVVEGNMVVKKVVASKPVLMGRKLRQDYVRGERFLELIIDVGSDKIADKIVKTCVGFSKGIVVDMAFILEGKDESALPERVMGAFRLDHIDFKTQSRVVEVTA